MSYFKDIMCRGLAFIADAVCDDDTSQSSVSENTFEDILNSFNNTRGKITQKHLGGLSAEQTTAIDDIITKRGSINFPLFEILMSQQKLLYRAFLSDFHFRVYRPQNQLDTILIGKVNAFVKSLLKLQSGQATDLKTVFEEIIDKEILDIVCEPTEATSRYIDQEKLHTLIHNQCNRSIGYIVNDILQDRIDEGFFETVRVNLTNTTQGCCNELLLVELINKFLDYRIGFTDLYLDEKYNKMQDKAITEKLTGGKKVYFYKGPDNDGQYPITKINGISVDAPK
ncbi:hypothetical protein N9N03_01275, partial [Chlamydiia bacterium]|nr:hypothetical protein [Chlamydiia bacterium]